MWEEVETSVYIDKSQIISVINKMLLYLDGRLVSHGERVAYITSELLLHADGALNLDPGLTMILSALHDIGAFKTEELDEMLDFGCHAIWNHSIYGYMFLKYMSPVGAAAEAILYHHLDFKNYSRAKSSYLNYAALIYLADRLDILVATSDGDCDLTRITRDSGTRFHPDFVALLLQSAPEEIIRRLRDGSYHEICEQRIRNLSVTSKQALEYLKMMVYSIDFRSEHTVTHTINTTAISLELGRRCFLPSDQLEKICLGALVHDIGKIAISPEILEFQGRLTPAQMEIMKQHVIFTEKIVDGLLPPDICRIACNHHEKLDGSGYPGGLKEADLSLSEQIVAVADIASALTSRRSYKDAYPKEKTLGILLQMKERGQLSPHVCGLMISCFDDIMHITDVSRDPVVRLYHKMHEEYEALYQKVLLLSTQEC